MLPFLRGGDFDGALASRWPRSTPRRRRRTPATLQRSAARSTRCSGSSARRCVFLGLVGWALFHWRRFGKDPVYLDDPSIHIPAAART